MGRGLPCSYCFGEEINIAGKRREEARQRRNVGIPQHRVPDVHPNHPPQGRAARCGFHVSLFPTIVDRVRNQMKVINIYIYIYMYIYTYL